MHPTNHAPIMHLRKLIFWSPGLGHVGQIGISQSDHNVEENKCKWWSSHYQDVVTNNRSAENKLWGLTLLCMCSISPTATVVFKIKTINRRLLIWSRASYSSVSSLMCYADGLKTLSNIRQAAQQREPSPGTWKNYTQGSLIIAH